MKFSKLNVNVVGDNIAINKISSFPIFSINSSKSTKHEAFSGSLIECMLLYQARAHEDMRHNKIQTKILDVTQLGIVILMSL